MRIFFMQIYAYWKILLGIMLSLWSSTSNYTTMFPINVILFPFLHESWVQHEYFSTVTKLLFHDSIPYDLKSIIF